MWWIHLWATCNSTPSAEKCFAEIRAEVDPTQRKCLKFQKKCVDPPLGPRWIQSCNFTVTLESTRDPFAICKFRASLGNRLRPGRRGRHPPSHMYVRICTPPHLHVCAHALAPCGFVVGMVNDYAGAESFWSRAGLRLVALGTLNAHADVPGRTHPTVR